MLPAPTLTPALPGFDLPPRPPEPPALTKAQQKRLEQARRAAVKALAHTVYDTIQRLAENRAQRISRANARQLVETYGAPAVERALEQLRRYHPSGRVASPVGWLIAAAQREYAEQERREPPRFAGVQRPRRQPAPDDQG